MRTATDKAKDGTTFCIGINPVDLETGEIRLERNILLLPRHCMCSQKVFTFNIEF